MQIHVGRDGQKLGEFSIEEVRAGLSASKFLPTDLAWAEGQPEWVPLASFPGIAAPPPPALPQDIPAGPPPLQKFAPVPLPPLSPPNSGLAITSLVCGILSMSCLPFVAAIPAIICGHVARSRIQRSGGAIGGEGMALAGLIIGYFSFVFIIPVVAILAGIALPVFSEVQVKAKQTKSMSQAKQIALGCRLYADDHQNSFPATLDELIPDYLPDRSVFVCPLSGPSVPIGYEYFGGKATDPPENVLLVSKAADRRGRRVVVHVDTSAAIEKYILSLPAPQL